MIALVLADKNDWTPIRIRAAAKQADIIISLGDLTYLDLLPLEDFTIPKLGVYGNHCTDMYLEDLGFLNLHKKTTEIAGLKFGGLEGCLRYKPTGDYLYTQEEVEAILEDFPSVDVMLSHAPPLGTHDKDLDEVHKGFRGLLDYVKNTNPRTLLHGHTHPDQKETILGGTRVVWVYGHELVELP